MVNDQYEPFGAQNINTYSGEDERDQEQDMNDQDDDYYNQDEDDFEQDEEY